MMKILFITAEGFDTPNPNNQMAEVMINDFLNNGFSGCSGVVPWQG